MIFFLEHRLDLQIPDTFSPLGALGFILVIVGIFLIVASYGVIRIQNVEILPGKTTRRIGMILALVGGLVLIADQVKSNPAILTLAPPAVTEAPVAVASPSSPGSTPATLEPSGATSWPLGEAITYIDPDAICSIQVEAAARMNQEKALKTMYNISSQRGYCGWRVNLNGYDASTQESLTFWLKGDAGGERLKLGLKDEVTPAGQEPKVLLTAPSAWERVSVPLEKFARVDLAILENFSINFEFNLGSGIIYVAGFIFE